MYTPGLVQDLVGFRSERRVEYPAVRSCMASIKERFAGSRIGYPRIGAGLAGGDWSVIREIIVEELAGEDHTLVEFAG